MTFTFSGTFNELGVRREYVGQGYTALYENLKESQWAPDRLRVRC